MSCRAAPLRVRVYAGLDPLTGKRHTLVEAVPAGPRAWRDAEAVRRRLVTAVQSADIRARARRSTSARPLPRRAPRREAHH